LKGQGRSFNDPDYPFNIWGVDPTIEWSGTLGRFLQDEDPDALFLNMDIFNCKEVNAYRKCADWSGPTIAYVILDGVPAYREYLESAGDADVFMASTLVGAEYLQSCGFSPVIMAPPGVDCSLFRPSRDTRCLRMKAGLEDKFVVGVFGRNTERKQQPRVLIALSHLRQMGKGADVALYFHCKQRGYWKLDEIAQHLGVENSVIFAEDLLDETSGVPYVSAARSLASGEAPSHNLMRMPADYSYVERLNCCDLVVNVPHCGDFEQVIIESQACGIPIAATDDRGIMAEAIGDGGLLLAAADIGFWKAGQRNFHVSPRSIADAIVSIKESQDLRERLIASGMANAQKYPWDALTDAMEQAVASL